MTAFEKTVIRLDFIFFITCITCLVVVTRYYTCLQKVSNEASNSKNAREGDVLGAVVASTGGGGGRSGTRSGGSSGGRGSGRGRVVTSKLRLCRGVIGSSLVLSGVEAKGREPVGAEVLELDKVDIGTGKVGNVLGAVEGIVLQLDGANIVLADG